MTRDEVEAAMQGFEAGRATVTIDDQRIAERLAEAWDEGFKAADIGTFCPHHEQNDFCAWGRMNPYRNYPDTQ